MTLDEAIMRMKHQADLLEDSAAGCDLCDPVEKDIAQRSEKGAEEYRQLTEWLKDYKRLKEQKSCEDVMSRILQRMWNCRGRHTISIDKVKMEQILRDELPFVKLQYTEDEIQKIQDLEQAEIEKAYELGKAEGQESKDKEMSDLISRQEAINAFEKFIHELGIEDEPYNYGEMALSPKNIPPVTP